MALGNLSIEAHVANGRVHLALGPALHIKSCVAVVFVRRLLVGVHEVELRMVLTLGHMHQDEASVLHTLLPSDCSIDCQQGPVAGGHTGSCTHLIHQLAL